MSSCASSRETRDSFRSPISPVLKDIASAIPCPAPPPISAASARSLSFHCANLGPCLGHSGVERGTRAQNFAGNVRNGSKAEILARSRCFPLYPRKRTSGIRAGMSELCHNRTHAPQQTASLFDHLVG